MKLKARLKLTLKTSYMKMKLSHQRNQILYLIVITVKKNQKTRRRIGHMLPWKRVLLKASVMMTQRHSQQMTSGKIPTGYTHTVNGPFRARVLISF